MFGRWDGIGTRSRAGITVGMALGLCLSCGASGAATLGARSGAVSSPVVVAPQGPNLAQHRGDATPRLSVGAHGRAVVRLQEQLSDLGFWLGRVDGRFGDATQQAVYALQKVAAISPDGVVGRKTWQALRREVRPVPRGSRGSHVEIDLRRDLIMFVTGDRLRYVVNTSTGGGFTYVSNGVTSIAATPTGRFRVYNEVNGLRISPLGELWRPKFFHGGYAIHGSASVPPYPASHGCVRVSNEAMNWIWSHGLLPMGMTVWIYR